MARVFRSKSCRQREPEPSPRSNDEEDEEDEEGNDDDFLESSDEKEVAARRRPREDSHQQQFPIMAILVAALRKSLICSVERGEDLCSMDIGWPTEVQHVSHVTFDRFHGFLGLPVELEPEVPRKVPSASASVFGVSAKSMQCSHDHRGNSVPTILLLMQRRLYSLGGLLAEGIFRINADNSQEEHVRELLSKGIIPESVDLHCLAGLIKAWFRELPTGVLDSLAPEQVMRCNTEEDCIQLMKSLPTSETALLDWAINLMADVAQYENHNKMNARNIAMVFAPNMTKMADPLNALIHAVQVMNFLKTLILKILREREESTADAMEFSSCSDSPHDECLTNPSKLSSKHALDWSNENIVNPNASGGTVTHRRFLSDVEETFWSIQTKSEADDECDTNSEDSATAGRGGKKTQSQYASGCNAGEFEGFLDRLSLKKGVRRLCRHTVLQLRKPAKKSIGLGISNSRGRGGEAWT